MTLDRVICCYDDMSALVGLSAARAKQLYGVVSPRDTWWLRLFILVQNIVMRTRRAPMRFFVYPTVAHDPRPGTGAACLQAGWPMAGGRLCPRPTLHAVAHGTQ